MPRAVGRGDEYNCRQSLQHPPSRTAATQTDHEQRGGLRMMDWNDNNITDEMLAAYIDGNATPIESALISDTMMHDDMLAEAIDIVNDTMNMDTDLLGNTDLFSTGMNSSFEDWFPTNGTGSFSTMPDVFNSLEGNDGLPPLSDDNDLMNDIFDINNNDF